MFAAIRIEESIPISADTQAGLQYRGVTGIAAIALKAAPVQAGRIVGNNAQPPLLIGDPALSQDV